MKVKTGVNFHNRFDVEVRDAITGKLKQQGFAENIVLNQMYSRICSFNTYFVNIHFGTGTGTLDPTRTSLFSHLGTKTAVDEEIIKAYPTSKWTRKITLNPEEYVGSTFTEVGVAYGSTNTNLVTHAMIKDSEGNPLALTKSALDVLVIYATVYITFTDGDTVFANSAQRNTLVNYFTTHSSITNTIGLGFHANPNAFRRSMIQASKACTQTADIPNRKVRFNTVRFGITEGNGPKNLAVLSNMLSYDMGSYVGGTILNELVGTGDGAKTEFRLASIYPDNVTVKVNGVTATDYTIQQSIGVYKIKDLDQGGNYVTAIAFVTRSPRDMYIFRTTSSWHRTQALDTFSGEYYYLENGYPYPYEAGVHVLFCDNDTIRYTGGKVYKYNPTTGSHQEIQTLSSVQRGSRLSHDGKLLLACKDTNGYSIFKWNETTQLFDNIQNISLNRASGCDISKDNRRLILSQYATGIGSKVYVYEYNNTTGLYEKVQEFTQENGPNSANPVYIELSPTEEFLVVNTFSYCKVYRYNGTGYGNAMDYPYTSAISFAYDTTFIGEHFFVTWVGQSSTIAGHMFEIRKSNDIIKFNTPPAQDAVITADYHVPYIPKDENHVLDVSFELQFGEGT